jgi:DNA-binding response OmpR family regulator
MNKLTGKQILVLEDEPLIMLMIEDILDEAAARFSGARTCPEALKLIENFVFDAAILDRRIGDGDCREVAQKLQEIGTPYVLATGVSGGDDLGAAVVTLKPYTADGLVNSLLAILPSTTPAAS